MKEKRLHYPQRTLRVDPIVWESLKKIKKKMSLSWNLLLVYFLEKEETDKKKNGQT